MGEDLQGLSKQVFLFVGKGEKPVTADFVVSGMM